MAFETRIKRAHPSLCQPVSSSALREREVGKDRSSSKGGQKRLVKYLLEVGFEPTLIAELDSFSHYWLLLKTY